MLSATWGRGSRRQRIVSSHAAAGFRLATFFVFRLAVRFLAAFFFVAPPGKYRVPVLSSNPAVEFGPWFRRIRLGSSGGEGRGFVLGGTP